jgi:membrane protease YdiL (CAAX protease family)
MGGAPGRPRSSTSHPALSAKFSAYHFFSPWQNLTRTLAVAPMSYAVSRTRSVWVSVLAHGLLNTIAMLLALPGLLR